jgi:hypothetical protein
MSFGSGTIAWTSGTVSSAAARRAVAPDDRVSVYFLAATVGAPLDFHR